jgi:hypothetical protein
MSRHPVSHPTNRHPVSHPTNRRKTLRKNHPGIRLGNRPVTHLVIRPATRPGIRLAILPTGDYRPKGALEYWGDWVAGRLMTCSRQ